MIQKAIDLYLKTYRTLPGDIKKWVRNKINTDEEFKELFTILCSFEINNYIYNKLFNVLSYKNVLNDLTDFSLLEYLGITFRSLEEKGYLETNKEVNRFPLEVQKIINHMISKNLIKFFGIDFILDTIDELYSWDNLLSDKFIYPNVFDLVNKEGFNPIYKNTSLSIDTLNFPCYIINLPKSTRKTSDLYYFIKKGNKIYSNVNNSEIRDYFKNAINKNEISCIFAFSKVKNKRLRKHFTPICFGNHTDILNLYKGRNNININKLDFNTQKYFNKNYALKYVDLKFISKIKKIDNESNLLSYVDKIQENNYIFFSDGIIKVKFTLVERFERIIDYILDDNFFPIGFIVESGAEYLYKIPDNFVESGIEGRAAKLIDYYLGDRLIKIQPKSIIGEGLFYCKACGAIESKAYGYFCKRCYKLFRLISLFTNTDLVIDKKPKELFFISMEKFDIEGNENNITFKLNYANAKGKQMRLPFADIYEDRIKNYENFI